MTTDEIRNWLAENQHTSDRSVVDTRDNAYPHTLDGAAKALPEGMRCSRRFTSKRWEWCVWKINHDDPHNDDWIPLYSNGSNVWCIDTGDEIHDRYRLAMEARKAMKQTKE